HVVAGTGYEFSLERLAFIDPSLRGQIQRWNISPKLSQHFESSVSGLYFVGPIAAESFGPLVRFVAGAPYAVGKTANRILRTTPPGQRRRRGTDTSEVPAAADRS